MITGTDIIFVLMRKDILSTDEYLNLYAEVSEKTEYDELVKNQNLWKPDKVYLLTVTLKNESEA